MDPGCWCWWHTWFIMKQQIAWWWQPLVLVSLFRNKLKGRGLWMWEAERLRGVKWRHTVTGPEYCSYNNHYPGPGAGRQSQSNVQSLKQQGGRRRCQLRLGGCWWRSQSRPLSKTKSPLPLCVGTFSVSLCLSLSAVFMTQRTHGPCAPGQESPMLWSQPAQLSPSNYDIRWHIPSIGTFKPGKC